MKCPHCNKDVRLVKGDSAAPPKGADTVGVGELLDAIDADALEGKAAEFVAQTRERYAQYKERTRMSDKQMAWLRNIANGEDF